MSNKNQHLSKFAHLSKNQVQNKQDKKSSTILVCFRQSLQYLQIATLVTQATSQIKRLDQPRNLCSISGGGWTGDVASRDGRTVDEHGLGNGRRDVYRLLRHFALGFFRVGCLVAFLPLWWILIGGVIDMQVGKIVDMQVILEHDEQPQCLDQGFASCGLYKIPTLIPATHYPYLHTTRNTFNDDRQQSYNAKNLTCTKIHSNTKTTNYFSFTMVAASKLPAYRPAGTRSGQRRPNESFSEQIARITKAKMAARDNQGDTSAKAALKTPPKIAGNVAPTTPPKAVGAKLLPTPPVEPPPWYMPAAPKAKVFIRPAVPRPPPMKKAASPYPPPAAPKDAALLGGYSGPHPKFPARPRPPTPPARPSRAPRVVDVDNIPEIPEAASGSASSGTAELPKATVGGPRRQIKLKELFIISRGTRPEAVQLTT